MEPGGVQIPSTGERLLREWSRPRRKECFTGSVSAHDMTSTGTMGRCLSSYAGSKLPLFSDTAMTQQVRTLWEPDDPCPGQTAGHILSPYCVCSFFLCFVEKDTQILGVACSGNSICRTKEGQETTPWGMPQQIPEIVPGTTGSSKEL